LHDEIKIIQNAVFLFSLKKEQNLISYCKQNSHNCWIHFLFNISAYS